MPGFISGDDTCMPRGRFRLYSALCLLVFVLAISPDVSHAGPKAPKLSRSKVSIMTGNSTRLKVKNYKKKVKWKSSNPYVAKVSSRGVIQAKHMGYTTIFAKAGDSVMQCLVTVFAKKKEKPFIYCYEADHDGEMIQTGESYNLGVMNGYNKTWTWTVNNPDLALFYHDGNSVTTCVTPGKYGQLVQTFMGHPGTVTITAKSGKTTLRYKLVVRQTKEDASWLKMRSQVLSSLIHPGMPPQQQCLAVARWLADYASYVITNGKDYSLLNDHIGQCYHYAKTYEFLMEGTGIPCDYVCTMVHAWNQVQIDGQWYNVDVTGFDTDNPLYPYDYTFFMVSDAAFWRRDARMDPYHACTSARYDFRKRFSDSPWADGTWGVKTGE